MEPFTCRVPQSSTGLSSFIKSIHKQNAIKNIDFSNLFNKLFKMFSIVSSSKHRCTSKKELILKSILRFFSVLTEIILIENLNVQLFIVYTTPRATN